MSEFNEEKDSPDSAVDAVVATALVLVFVAACIFWIAGQS